MTDSLTLQHYNSSTLQLFNTTTLPRRSRPFGEASERRLFEFRLSLLFDILSLTLRSSQSIFSLWVGGVGGEWMGSDNKVLEKHVGTMWALKISVWEVGGKWVGTLEIQGKTTLLYIFSREICIFWTIWKKKKDFLQRLGKSEKKDDKVKTWTQKKGD